MESTAEKLNEVPAEVECGPAEVADTTPPAPTIVSENDRLKAEVLSLKHLNAVNRETILQQQMVQLQQQMKEAQREKQDYTDQLTAMRKELEARYHISLVTHTIMPNGLVVPRSEMPKVTPSLQQLKG